MQPRALVPAVLLCGALAAPCRSQVVAVYESEANSEQYHGAYQEPLRTWLTQRGQDFAVIGDEVAADPARLAEYPVVLTSSSYIVPEAVCRGIADHLAAGGRVIWIDSPARCADPAFREVLGLSPNSTYAPMRNCTVEAKQPTSPAAISVSRFEAPSLVGNPAVAAAPQATVLYELAGTAEDGGEVRYPAVVLAAHGKGKSLCYNWILWASREREARALLADGLDYMLADHWLQTHPAAAVCSLGATHVRQPEPIALSCRIFRVAGGAAPDAKCEVSLLRPGGQAVRRTVAMKWSHADQAMAAATASVEVPTEGLADGTCTIACQASFGNVTAVAKEVTVMLEGQLWARLREEDQKRRELLAPRLLHTLGDYDAEPRTPEGRVDIPRLIDQITGAHMNTYDWLVWHAGTDWDDLHAFLPLARDKGINVWVTLCPPSEQGGDYPSSEPYRLDFIKWAEEIGKLSRQFDNVAAMVIDDFWSGGNRDLFTPDYIARLASTLRAQNPDVAFLPTIYWDTVGDQQWMQNYGTAIDGIVFPYAELETGEALADQLRACREWIGPTKYLMVNVYASGSSGTREPGPRTAEYMRRVLTTSREMADGIRIYCLPKAQMMNDYRYAITAELYEKWRADDRGGR